MFAYQYIYILMLLIFSFSRASRFGALVLFCATIINLLLVSSSIPPESYIVYYLLSALTNISVGFILHRKYNSTALCSYALTVADFYGAVIWYMYLPHYSYDSICFIILIIQLITIIPKGSINGAIKKPDSLFVGRRKHNI